MAKKDISNTVLLKEIKALREEVAALKKPPVIQFIPQPYPVYMQPYIYIQPYQQPWYYHQPSFQGSNNLQNALGVYNG